MSLTGFEKWEDSNTCPEQEHQRVIGSLDDAASAVQAEVNHKCSQARYSTNMAIQIILSWRPEAL